ncbi:MAG TPA: hypothetical protein ENH01_13525 [Nitrospirae bacterium]|nr:hypothetical protein [Nitrospirota bacterium]
MATSITEKTKFTYKDYLKTPDDKRYELVEGELLMTPSPATCHEWILKNIGYELESFSEDKTLESPLLTDLKIKLSEVFEF